MKTFRLSLSALTVAIAANAYAADPPCTALDAVSVTASNRIVVDCGNEQRPTLRAVADVLDTNNGSRIYAEREHMVHIAHRECMRGAGYVAFVRDGADPAAALARAEPTARPSSEGGGLRIEAGGPGNMRVAADAGERACVVRCDVRQQTPRSRSTLKCAPGGCVRVDANATSQKRMEAIICS